MRARLSLGAFLVGGALAIFGASAASADNGALVFKDTGTCGALDATGGLVSINRDRQVVNHSGTINFVCRGAVTPPANGTSVTWDNANTGRVYKYGNCTPTTDWSETITPNGAVTLTATFTGCS
jgi:hypothetical protein